MIDFDNELAARIGKHSRSVLSVTGPDGYPISIPLPFHFDDTEHTFTLPIGPNGLTLPTQGRTALTLLYYNPQVANERFLAFQGTLTATEHGYKFLPARLILPPWEKK